MKKIEAVIFPSRLDAVRVELERRRIHGALTVTEVRQDDSQKTRDLAEKETAGSLEYRVKVELIVGDRQAPKAMDIIMHHAQVATNEAAGQVALLSVNQALQIVSALPREFSWDI